MGWTKRDILNQAFEEIALASYAFNTTADEYQSALRRLDTMMAEWDGKGIRLGYLMPTNPANSDPNQDSGLPDTALNGVASNLAVRIAPIFGKTVSMETRQAAKAGYDAILLANYTLPTVQYPTTLPIGSGNKPIVKYPQYYAPVDNLTTGNDSELEF